MSTCYGRALLILAQQKICETRIHPSTYMHTYVMRGHIDVISDARVNVNALAKKRVNLFLVISNIVTLITLSAWLCFPTKIVCMYILMVTSDST
jgi:hypothetical protein